MKIKVINLKNLSGYYSKVLILVVIGLICGKFFYNTKNITSSYKIDSAFFLRLINKEIGLFNNRSGGSIRKKLDSHFYSKKTIDEEIGMVKMTMSTNAYGESGNFNVENPTSMLPDNSEENLTEANTQEVNAADNYQEPETRTKYRNSTIKCAR